MLATMEPEALQHNADSSTFSFIVEKGALLKALTHTQSVVERRHTIPILANMLMRNEGGQLSITVTDMDMDMNEVIPAVECADGGTTLPVHMLFDIVRKLPDGAQISLLVKNNRATLTSGRARFNLPCLPAEDFPVLHHGNLPVQFSIEGADLKKLIDNTKFAMSSEETRYFLNGIYLHACSDSTGRAVLRAVATDGHRLAMAQVLQPEGCAGMAGVIIPRKMVLELRKIIDESDAKIHINLSDNKISVRCGGVRLTSKLIDGTFPDYSKVIPAGNDQELMVDCQTLSQAVDRVSTVATDKLRAVKFSITAQQLVLSSSGGDANQGADELEAAFTGDTLEIGFNVRYLLEALNQIGSKQVKFQIKDSATPSIITEEASADALFVLMPMRV